jgi:dihydroxyacid dehydratase/phosphogluconate dehydratase
MALEALAPRLQGSTGTALAAGADRGGSALRLRSNMSVPGRWRNEGEMRKALIRAQYSRVVVDGVTSRRASRAMLRAVGFRDEDFPAPQIGVASTWANLTPCNMHIGELAREACAGVDAAGAKSVLFNTITVSDGISMGTPGMRYSLISREVIADSIETVVGAAGFRWLRGDRWL